jgi:TPR repeat protein
MKELPTNSIWRAPDGARPLSPHLVAQLREEADHGGLTSRYFFGRMFQRGEVVPKDMDEALKWYQKVEDADAVDLNNLAWSLATSDDRQTLDITNAVRFASKAVALKPIANYWNTLGVAQYRAGAFKQAIATLEKSMQSASRSDGWNLFFLAMAHHQLGETDAGRDCFTKGIQWMAQNDPDSQELLQYRNEASVVLGASPK